MRIFGLAGWSGSGKTTLLTAIIPHFVARGLVVSTIKHAHHEFDIDRPGKDCGVTVKPVRARSWSPRRGAGR
jgi:molybdopterin-guanine dinucleotide biosynthesis protein B